MLVPRPSKACMKLLKMGPGWQPLCGGLCDELRTGTAGCFPAGLARAEHNPVPPTSLAMGGTGRQAQLLWETQAG